MSKGKTRSLAANPELHFYSSISLDHAAHLIERLSGYSVAVEGIDEDTCRFSINPFAGSEAQVRGTIRRWEGTYTRLDCTGDVVRQSDLIARERWATPESRRERNDTPLLVFGAAIFLAIWLNNYLKLPPAGFLILALLGISAAVMFYLFFLDQGDREKIQEDKIYFRERDAILNALIKAFQGAGVVAHRPDELVEKLIDSPSIGALLTDSAIPPEMKHKN